MLSASKMFAYKIGVDDYLGGVHCLVTRCHLRPSLRA